MDLTNEVVLRPRFQRALNNDKSAILANFETVSKTQKKFIVNIVTQHVFIRFPKKEQSFWTPQLHLEIEETSPNKSLLKGLFGPKPTVWTLFMFLHFIVGTLFTGLAALTYSLWSLNKSPLWPIIGLFVLFIIWFLLYFGGRIGKNSKTKEMLALYNFMESVLPA